MKKRIFLSSAERGLRDARRNLSDALRCLDGVDLVRYEDFSASPESGVEKCLSEIRTCDLFIVICGPFLGTQYKGGSIVEAEYETARQAKIPCLAFLASDDFKVRLGDVEPDDKRAALTRAHKLRATC